MVGIDFYNKFVISLITAMTIITLIRILRVFFVILEISFKCVFSFFRYFICTSLIRELGTTLRV